MNIKKALKASQRQEEEQMIADSHSVDKRKQPKTKATLLVSSLCSSKLLRLRLRPCPHKRATSCSFSTGLVYSYLTLGWVPIIIIIQYLYSALKSCTGYIGAGGFRLRLSEQVCFEVFFRGKVWQDLMSDGCKFQRMFGDNYSHPVTQPTVCVKAVTGSPQIQLC